MNLQKVRTLLLIRFGRSTYWTWFDWVKKEWQVKRLDGRLWFLQECRRRKLLPRFISDRIQTGRLFRNEDVTAIETRQRYGMEVLRLLIKEEFKEKKRALKHV